MFLNMLLGIQATKKKKPFFVLKVTEVFLQLAPATMNQTKSRAKLSRKWKCLDKLFSCF